MTEEEFQELLKEEEFAVNNSEQAVLRKKLVPILEDLAPALAACPDCRGERDEFNRIPQLIPHLNDHWYYAHTEPHEMYWHLRKGVDPELATDDDVFVCDHTEYWVTVARLRR